MNDHANPPPSFDPPEFDRWAEGYDEETDTAAGFPFEGYAGVLEEIIRCAHISRPQRVLDVGAGTGNLALRFYALGSTVWGTDFSQAMLEKARRKVHPEEGEPLEGIIFSHWDLREPWPEDLPDVLDRIVSAYTLHHFTFEHKMALLQDFRAHLAPGGKIVIGDISFETQDHLNRARIQSGDAWDEEYYWTADQTLPALARAGFQASYRQVSNCAGVYCIRPQ